MSADKMCQSKRSYVTQSEALRVAEQRREKDQVALGTYRCPHCRFWHLTKRTGATAKLQTGDGVSERLKRQRDRKKTDKQKLYDANVRIKELEQQNAQMRALLSSTCERLPDPPEGCECDGCQFARKGATDAK